MKWLITLVNIGDVFIPVERVSSFQQFAMCSTGMVWARYSTQITPVNYGLMGANLCMAMIAAYQLYRKG
jgi:mitochondrial pyruvate carrier 2